MKPLRLSSLLIVIAIAVSANVSAAVIIPVQFIIENGNYELSLVTVKKNGESIYTTDGSRNMRLKLENNNDYILAFSKPGYITKLIHINTTAPAARLKIGFDPYKIGVRLFKQYEGVNTVVYNQPVAYIRYREDADELGYDTDYTKSILSALQPVEHALEKKAMEERDILKLNRQHSTAETTLVNKNDKATNANEVAEKKPMVVKDIPARVNPVEENADNGNMPAVSKPAGGIENKIAGNPGSGDDDFKHPAGEGAENYNGSNVGTNGSDLPKNAPGPVMSAETIPEISPVYLSYNRSVYEIKEPNRIITVIRYIKGQEQTEFRSVHYNSGETYYFMNGTTGISQHLFRYFTGEHE